MIIIHSSPMTLNFDIWPNKGTVPITLTVHPLKRKNVRRKENTRETNKPQKEKRKLNTEKQDEIARRIYKTKYSFLSFSLFRLVIPLLFCYGYYPSPFFAFKFRLAISSCYLVLQFRLRLRFSLVLIVAGIYSRKIHASVSFWCRLRLRLFICLALMLAMSSNFFS